MSVNNTLVGEIDRIVVSRINSIPFPQKAKIKKIYEDDGYCDIIVDNQLLKYVEYVGTPVVDKTGVLIFCNGNPNDYILIC